MSSPKPQALVFGASGISGWAIVREALCHPFSRIVAISKNPIHPEQFTLLPLADVSRIHCYSINLRRDPKTVYEQLQSIEDIDKVTHVYYAGKCFRMKNAASRLAEPWLETNHQPTKK